MRARGFLDLSTRCRWMVSFTLLLLCFLGKTPWYLFGSEARWASVPDGHYEEEDLLHLPRIKSCRQAEYLKIGYDHFESFFGSSFRIDFASTATWSVQSAEIVDMKKPRINSVAWLQGLLSAVDLYFLFYRSKNSSALRPTPTSETQSWVN
jgi:hypothetical protein